MKIETPQILWNSEEGKGLNAALMSVSMVQSGIDVAGIGGTAAPHGGGGAATPRSPTTPSQQQQQSSSAGEATAAFVATPSSAAAAPDPDPQAGASASQKQYTNVLATAGNTNIINLWKVTFVDGPEKGSTAGTPQGIFQRYQPTSKTGAGNGGITSGGVNIQNNTKIEFMCSLTRHEGPVNVVSFSPDGLHLVTGGDTGYVIVYSVPVQMRGNNNGKHYWSTVQREQDLSVRIVLRNGDAISDISWSSDSKRFVAGTIDHTVFVCEDQSYDANHRAQGAPATSPEQPQIQSDSAWEIVYRNRHDHTHYVQGVAYDPLGVYLASMSSDRTVRVYPRKAPPKHKKKVLRPPSTLSPSNPNHNGSPLASSLPGPVPPADHQRMVDALLTEARFELSTKSKLVKYRRTSTNVPAEEDENGVSGAGGANAATRKHYMFADESTLESFFRRLSWTADGAFLVLPAALWHNDDDASSAGAKNAGTCSGSKSSPSYATFVFQRHRFDEPYKVLSGLEKPSVVVRPNPVLFQLPPRSGAEIEDDDMKENQSPGRVPDDTTNRFRPSRAEPSGKGSLPYRSVFCVLTWDTVLIYDTFHDKPLSVIRGLHYSNFSDAVWSADGMNLIVSSTDGYISIISFAQGELGQVYKPPSSHPTTSVLGAQGAMLPTSSPKNEGTVGTTIATSYVPRSAVRIVDMPPIPPCEPGQSATIEAPPAKRAKKTRIAPTLISPAPVHSPQESSTRRSGSIENDGRNRDNGSTSSSTATEEVLMKITLPSMSAPVKASAVLPSKRPASPSPPPRCGNDISEQVGEAVDKLTLDQPSVTSKVVSTDEAPKKKKKRIQPMLLSAS